MWPEEYSTDLSPNMEKTLKRIREQRKRSNKLTKEEYLKRKRACRRMQWQWTEGSYNHEMAKRDEAKLDEQWRLQQEADQD